MAEALAGLSGYRRIVDDVVIYDQDIAEHANHLREFLQRCADMNITLNMEKCKFCQTGVAFAGFRLSAEGYQVDTSITDAIHSFPTPASSPICAHFLGWQTIYPHAVPWHYC